MESTPEKTAPSGCNVRLTTPRGESSAMSKKIINLNSKVEGESIQENKHIQYNNLDTLRGIWIDGNGNKVNYRVLMHGKDTMDQKYYVPDGY